MRIALPTDGTVPGDQVSYHFGRCRNYIILDENGKVVEILKNTSEHMGGTGLPPELLKQHNVDVLICAGLGPRAIELSQQAGIKVFVGPPMAVSELFSLWKEGKLQEATKDSACESHKE